VGDLRIDVVDGAQAFAGIHSFPRVFANTTVTARLAVPPTGGINAFMIASAGTNDFFGVLIHDAVIELHASSSIADVFALDDYRAFRMMSSTSEVTVEASSDDFTFVLLGSFVPENPLDGEYTLDLSAGGIADGDAEAAWDDVVVETNECAACRSPLFADHFDKGAFDGTLWGFSYGSTLRNTDGGTLNFEVPVDQVGSEAVGAQSDERYNFLGAEFEVHIVTPPPSGNEVLYALATGDDGNWGFQLYRGNELQLYAGEIADSIPFDAIDHEWLRMRVVGVDVIYEASPDGIEYTEVGRELFGASLTESLVNVGAVNDGIVNGEDVTLLQVDDVTVRPICP
jgi:hypothetical protein